MQTVFGGPLQEMLSSSNSPHGSTASGRPSRRGVSRNGVLAEKFHILTSTGALNLQLFDCKYEDVRKAAVLQMLEAIFAKH